MSHPLRVAIIDDDIDCLDLTRSILETKGYAVSCYSDPDKALAGMSSDVPDIIITDLMMSTLDSGFALSRHVRQTPALANTPIIVLTAVASKMGYDFRPASESDLTAMQIDALFEKPVDAKALLKKIAELAPRST